MKRILEVLSPSNGEGGADPNKVLHLDIVAGNIHRIISTSVLLMSIQVVQQQQSQTWYVTTKKQKGKYLPNSTLLSLFFFSSVFVGTLLRVFAPLSPPTD